VRLRHHVARKQLGLDEEIPITRRSDGRPANVLGRHDATGRQAVLAEFERLGFSRTALRLQSLFSAFMPVCEELQRYGRMWHQA